MDGCDASCAVESGYTCTGEPSTCDTTCGDGVAAGNEECDDGNMVDGDGCSATCTTEMMGTGGGGAGGGGTGGAGVGGTGPGTGTGTGTGAPGTGGGGTGGSDSGDGGSGDDGGCGCRVLGAAPLEDEGKTAALLGLMGLAFLRRRRRLTT